MLPSRPAARRYGSLAAVGTVNSLVFGPGVMRPIRLALLSMNHRLPSAPVEMPIGRLFTVRPAENSVMTPAGVIRPIRPPLGSVNHKLPSGPAETRYGSLPALSP